MQRGKYAVTKKFVLYLTFFCSLLEKRKPYRDQFLYEKALKTDIVWGTLRAYNRI